MRIPTFLLSSTLIGLVSGNCVLPSCGPSMFQPSESDSQTPTSASPHSLASAAALAVRGGDVQEPTTLQEVEDAVMKASAEGKVVVIDFSATWCGPCKMIAPLYHEFSELDEYSGIVFLKIDVDENPDTAAKYGVSAMPTFIFIKQGEVVDKLMGANPPKLKEMLDELS